MSAVSKKRLQSIIEQCAQDMKAELMSEMSELKATVTLFGWGATTVYLDGDADFSLECENNWLEEIEEKIAEEIEHGCVAEDRPRYRKTLKTLRTCVQRLEDALIEAKQGVGK